MLETQELTITLPNEIAEAVRSRVASGEYASESDVLSAGFLHLVGLEQDLDKSLGMGEKAFKDWLRIEVVPVMNAMKADPSRGRSLEQVRERLAREHLNFQKAG